LTKFIILGRQAQHLLRLNAEISSICDKIGFMKPALLNNFRSALLPLAIFFCLSSCSSTKKVPFNTSTVTPAAEGTVKVGKDKNGNYLLDITVDNLADSKKLTPSKNAYVVWIETGNGTKNVGQIHSSSSMFSKAKKASV
jgi:hypothetical protein